MERGFHLLQVMRQFERGGNTGIHFKETVTVLAWLYSMLLVSLFLCNYLGYSSIQQNLKRNIATGTGRSEVKCVPVGTGL